MDADSVRDIHDNRPQSTWPLNLAVVFLVFLATAFLLAPRWAEYLSVSALNQLDTDFLYFDVIHNNLGDYSNILISNVVERVHASFGFLLGVSSLLNAMGVDQGVQLVVFFYAQLLLGIVGIYSIGRGLVLGREEMALLIAFFLFSYFIQFGRYLGGPGFYNKVTVSCFAMSVGYVIIALFVNARYRLGITLSALLIYVHPVYAAVFLGLIGLYGMKSYLIDQNWQHRYAITFVLFPALTLLPFLVGVLSSTDGMVDGGNISSVWWEFLKAKTSNPFPMQDGLVIVVPSLLVFAITFLLLGRLASGASAQAFGRARWVLGGVIVAWLVQIVFTEIIPVSFVARLSLTRTTPFALFFAVTAYVVTVWRFRDRDDSGLWLFLLVAPAVLSSSHLIADEVVRGLFAEYPMVLLVLGGYWPDFAIYPDILLLFVLLLAYAFRTGMLNIPGVLRPMFGDKAYFVRLLFATFAVLLAVTIWFGGIQLSTRWNAGLAVSLFASLLLLIWVLERLLPLMILAKASVAVRRHATWIAAVLVLIVALPLVPRAADALLGENAGDPDVAAMWNFIDQHTRKNEMVLVVPFFDTRKYPVMPLRPVFIDWSDAQYVLYDPEILGDVMERLRLIGMNLDKAMAAERCAGAYQYLDAMCRRKLFESLSTDYTDAWRDNLPQMREIAPNLTYVLMNNRYVTPSDALLFSSGEISLIRL